MQNYANQCFLEVSPKQKSLTELTRSKKKNAKYLNIFYSLTPDKSLFEISMEGSIEDREEEKTEKSCYCSVEGELNQEEKCDYNANLFAKMDSSRTEVITSQLNDQSKFSKKRSVNSDWYSDDVIDHVERSYFVDDPQVQHAMNRIRRKRSFKTVMSEDAARKYCRQYMKKSEAGRSCKGISELGYLNAIDQCTKDLQVRMNNGLISVGILLDRIH